MRQVRSFAGLLHLYATVEHSVRQALVLCYRASVPYLLVEKLQFLLKVDFVPSGLTACE
jgi:hypothetical protein